MSLSVDELLVKQFEASRRETKEDIKQVKEDIKEDIKDVKKEMCKRMDEFQIQIKAHRCQDVQKAMAHIESHTRFTKAAKWAIAAITAIISVLAKLH